MNIKKLYTYLSILLLSVSLTGCKDFLTSYSQDLVIPKTIDDLNELLIGSAYVKSYQITYGANAGFCGFFNILDDDINTVSVSSTGKNGVYGYDQTIKALFGIYTWQEDERLNFPKNNRVSLDATWNQLYRGIAVSSYILEEAENVPHSNDKEMDTYHRVVGEALFLRGYYYFILANLYGDAYNPATAAEKPCVPLKTTPYVEHDQNKKRQFERSTVADVYNQIVADLKASEEAFSMVVTPRETKHLHRASLPVAELLLSRVYLYMQDWANAQAEAEKVIQSNGEQLAQLTDFESDKPFFQADGKNGELIFTQGPNSIAPKGSNSEQFLTGQSGDYCVTEQLFNTYDDNDVRKSSFFGQSTNPDSLSLKKYERGVEVNHVSDVMTFRISEAYLNYAEACAMQPSLESEALKTLNEFKAHRIRNYTPANYSGEELATQIREERRRELCFEGQRWFDLRRYAVRDPYPFSKSIIHAYCEFNDNAYFIADHFYILLPNDPAYTFTIPPTASNADKIPMDNNFREKRTEDIELGKARAEQLKKEAEERKKQKEEEKNNDD